MSPDEYDVTVTDALLFGTRACTTCGAEKPDCSTYFRVYRGKILGQCRACHQETCRKRYAEKVETGGIHGCNC